MLTGLSWFRTKSRALLQHVKYMRLEFLMSLNIKITDLCGVKTTVWVMGFRVPVEAL
jgi:hypothetical protein